MEEDPSLEPLQGADWLSRLPEDVLWKILGFLDLPDIYRARLVCKSFRMPAARHFKALDCRALEEPPTTDFRQFSRVAYLAVTVSHKSHLQSLAQPRIAPFVTHVVLKGFHLSDVQTVQQLEAVFTRLPRLRSVSLQPLQGSSRLPLFPPGLQELTITDRHSLANVRWAGVGDASPLTRCSQLTSLAIDLRMGAEKSMGSLSSLRKLRSLDLCSCSSALGHLSTFTALTSLTFEGKYSEFYADFGSVSQDRACLTGLSRLVLSHISPLQLVKHADLACIAQLTNLTCLDMGGCTFSGFVRSTTALAPLTRLVSVRFSDAACMPRLSNPQVEALRSLSVHNVSDISILQYATRLTHLNLSYNSQRDRSNVFFKYQRCPANVPALCTVVAGLTRLRSLEISVHDDSDDEDLDRPHDVPVLGLDAVLGKCTMLTKLVYGGWKLRPERDLKACASLPGLRSLSFECMHELTPAWLPALQAMTRLTELSLRFTGISVADMTPDVIAAFDAGRRQLGWPRLKLRVEVMNERGGFDLLEQ